MKKSNLILLFSLIGIIALIATTFVEVSGQNMASGFIFFGLVAVAVIMFFFLMWLVYKDAKQKGLSENYWLLVLLLGFIGAIIYWFISRKK
ncbi:hypothetical protein ACFL96_09355 [Thermoproteota archaeon]